ncbi:hypothetical protein [Gottfriedia acidiceleris]|uniref:hypothetical protein n=1 Tax=Gottfriedia acidiceleris TaxID=371036 RepID=UPI001F2338B8|nr:hypothetical protein [Gottfriedia acidiceleris]
MGYRNQNITLDLDERYLNLNEYAKAVKAELESQGKTVDYRGNRLFIINGKQYHLMNEMYQWVVFHYNIRSFKRYK